MPKTFLEKVDEYKDTVFAIIGFANLFRFDKTTNAMREEVKISQGRRMKTSSANKVSPDNTITPDLTIQVNEQNGVLAEVKISFPQNNEFWDDDFKQLLSYDDELENWWTDNIRNHDIVLIPHQTRAIAVQEFYLKKKEEGSISFNRPFSIVEFARIHQAKGFFNFRKIFGEITASQEVSYSLKYGVPVPMEKLMLHYEKHKIYDSKPPMPHFLALLWENVILRWASERGEFRNLRKNSKLQIETNVDAITQELYEYCSFKGFNSGEEDYQPKMPLKSWVIEGINALVKFNLAEWINQNEGICKIIFKKMDAVFHKFIELCEEHGIDTEDLEMGNKQGNLFSGS